MSIRQQEFYRANAMEAVKKCAIASPRERAVE